MTQIKHFRLIVLGAVLAMSEVILPSATLALNSYAVTDFGVGMYPASINDLGQVLVVEENSGASYLYDKNGLQPLGINGARVMNNFGQIVGASQFNVPGVSGTKQHAFLYEGTTVKDIGSPLYPALRSYAMDINNSGQVIINCDYNPLLYYSGTWKNIGTLGGYNSRAESINDLGQVVGYSYLRDWSNLRAFIYDNNSMTNLGTLGGDYSHAARINNSSQVVGYSTILGDNSVHAFLYEDGLMKDLGTFGGDYGYAVDINDLGQVVCYSARKDIGGGVSDYHYYIYEKGSLIDFDSLISSALSLEVRSAQINNLGQIIGWGYGDNGRAHGFLLSPSATTVPEPSTALFLGVGFVGLWLRKRLKLCE